jgi:glycosyltransferase involved in cell wall biosynthesis
MNQVPARKRIALLVPGGVGSEGSGMHLPWLRHLVESVAETHEVSVYSLARPDWAVRTGWCGNARVTFLPVHHQKESAKKLWLLSRACWNDHRTQQFDIIHGFWAIPSGTVAVALGKCLGIPSIASFLGGETANLPRIRYGNMARPSTKAVTLWVARHADALTTLTRHQAGELRIAGCPRQDVQIIPFGTDIQLFSPTEKDISTRPLRILHVANLHAIKDQPMLMRTFARISQRQDARLRIIGNDQSKGLIHQLAARMGLVEKVELLGSLPQRELVRHYQWAQILIHTSLHEAQGAVLSEAAACGVLVAGTQTGLLADLGDSMAILCPVEDSDTLSEKILSVVDDPPTYDRLRRAAQAWALMHDFSWTVRKFLTLYDHVRVPGTRRTE